MKQNGEVSKKRLDPREDCTADEFYAYLDAHEKNPDPVLDRTSLERQTVTWHSEWKKTGLGPLQSGEDIFQRPKRVVRLAPQQEFVMRSLILFDKPTGEFVEFRGKGVSFLNRLSLAGIDDADIDLEAEKWARSRLSGRVMKSKGEIVNGPKK